MGNTHTKAYQELATNIPARSLSALLKVSSSLTSTLDLSGILQIASDIVVDLLSVDTAAIYTLEDEILYLGATTPALPQDFSDLLRAASLDNHPNIARTISQQKPVYIEDTKTALLTPHERIAVETRSLVSILYFPLLLKDNAIGAFILGTTRQVRKFTSDEINLAYILSYQVSLAIANARLFQETYHSLQIVNQAYTETLEGWSHMLDLRDHATDAHTHRSIDLTLILAEKLGIPSSKMEDIRRGALLHDIGKMGIPDTILLKKEKLTDAEFEIMKTHPEKAYQVLSQIDYLADALDIPYCHHEKWDGTGYPRQLKGEEIPIAARIFAVVDVYDALTTDRPYRKAWTKQDAIEYIKNQAGKHFYPAAVSAFLDILNS